MRIPTRADSASSEVLTMRSNAHQRREALASGYQQAGVGEQSDTGCPHSEDSLPCRACLTEGDA